SVQLQVWMVQPPKHAVANGAYVAGTSVPASMSVSSSNLVGMRQSLCPANPPEAFRAARKPVTMVPFMSPFPVDHVYSLSLSWIPPALSFFSHIRPVASSVMVPSPLSVNDLSTPV